MKTLVTTFENPVANIKMSNIVINPEKFTFSLTLGTKTKKQRNYHEEVVTGKISKELHDWLMKRFDERVQVKADNEQGYQWIKTGKKLTGFQAFLSKNNLEYKPGLLNKLVFESDNNSEEYAQNPFKIIQYLDGHATLTLVNVGVKKVVTEENPITGEVTQFFKQNFVKLGDRMVPQFFSKKNFIRLKKQIMKEVEVFQPQTANA